MTCEKGDAQALHEPQFSGWFLLDALPLGKKHKKPALPKSDPVMIPNIPQREIYTAT
jgi:hypothetical protein